MRRLIDDSLPQAVPAGESYARGVAVLAVGDTAEWLRRNKPVPPGGRIILASFSDLSRQLLDRVRPRLVLSPLLAREFDCIDLAQMLFTLGYTGQYRVITNDLPDPRVVVAEIRQFCPGLDFAILTTLPDR